MDEPEKKKRWERRAYTPEFKAEAVRLCSVGNRSVRQVARDLDLTETALRNWVKQAAKAATASPGGALTTAEREELVRLRRENKKLLVEREILKKATAFFAKENT
jgi:transposase-like protein